MRQYISIRSVISNERWDGRSGRLPHLVPVRSDGRGSADHEEEEPGSAAGTRRGAVVRRTPLREDGPREGRERGRR